MVIDSVNTYGYKGNRFGRRMVQAIERVGKESCLKISYILENGNPEFWEKMDYMFISENYHDKLKEIITPIPSATMYKNLK